MVCCAVRWECDRSVPSWATINFKLLGWGWEGKINTGVGWEMNCQGSTFFNGMKKSKKNRKKIIRLRPFKARQEDALWVGIRVETQFRLCIFDGISSALGFGSAESPFRRTRGSWAWLLLGSHPALSLQGTSVVPSLATEPWCLYEVLSLFCFLRTFSNQHFTFLVLFSFVNCEENFSFLAHCMIKLLDKATRKGTRKGRGFSRQGWHGE